MFVRQGSRKIGVDAIVQARSYSALVHRSMTLNWVPTLPPLASSWCLYGVCLCALSLSLTGHSIFECDTQVMGGLHVGPDLCPWSACQT
ncbi:hypothetical protein DPMN_156375 [Dreissena polymorpha]|uniref:Uncharacterized protein n=1 Tax=Dreissena polymorpha TaxID=45954 RepID=A0A9D4FR54_DREPO|nr:hypothetical protein DPMN_156375 [Dreissena polymorpha]